MTKPNPQQRRAITCSDRHLLVLAGAGSGKTRVITEKIAHLLQKGAAPDSIVAVTFTNKAANEMRGRVAALVSREQAAALQISTFHTLGLNLLRKECRHLGYRPGMTILGPDDVQTVLQQILQRDSQGYDGDEKNLAWRISQFKNAMTVSSDTADAQAMATLYQAYQQQIKAYNAVDFDDLILQPMLLLQNNAEVRARWQDRIRYLLVDEYQDTNGTQYEFVRLLLGAEAKLTAVGDDDQSIYAWRGAQPENMQRLIEDLPGLEVIKLEQNYRSTGCILKCANQLIGNNPHHFEKKLWSGLGYGDPVKVLSCDSAEDEAERVVNEIIHLKFQQSMRNRDFAILYRGNHQSRPFESMLRLHSIPYKVSGGTAFFDRAEIKDLLAYLRLVANSDDDAALLRIINVPRREIGASSLEKLAEIASANQTSLYLAIGLALADKNIVNPMRSRLAQFFDWMQEIKRAAGSEKAPAVLRRILNDTGYADWLRNSVKDKNAADSRLKNIEELTEWVQNLSRKQDEGLNVEELTAKLSLMDMLERREDSDELDAVQLMTLHAAKGLEFPWVCLAGFEEGLLPHHGSDSDEGIQEERRLAYVGITRARQQLLISHARTRKRQGEAAGCEPSRFLAELPADDLQWEGRNTGSSEEKRARGSANLNSLRNLLNNSN
ncbi:MAG TPA: UvrD-helicase domain-containing protein [Gammaproteobacteria bacterium]|nr:UvrD-helicase domain-containing protein [Gammaproteobacteria bacterium]